MVVRITTTYVINAYHHSSYELESPLWRGVFHITLYDKILSVIAAGHWFSPVSSTNKTDYHDITKILLKVALNTITLTLTRRTYDHL